MCFNFNVIGFIIMMACVFVQVNVDNSPSICLGNVCKFVSVCHSLEFTFVIFTEVKQRKPRKESSSRSPKKKSKGKNPWETDSEVEDEELSSEDDGVSRPPPRTTSRRTAGGTLSCYI
jgi:hypothetical protein